MQETSTSPADTGTLNSWTLDVKTRCPRARPRRRRRTSSGRAAPSPTATRRVLVRTLQVSGANPYLTDLNLGTQITHAFEPETSTSR